MVYVAPEIMDRIIKLYFEDHRSQKSLADEFGLSQNVVRRIVTNYRKECQNNKAEAENLRIMEENRKLKEQNEELMKEVDFLKKAAAFFAKENK